MSKQENQENGVFPPKTKALLCLDVGTKRIGMALCNPSWSVVTPFQTIHRKKFSLDAPQIIKIIKEWEIGGLVIGLPLNMDGTEGPMCQSVRDFGRNLQGFDQFPAGLPVFYQDERLTSDSAEKFLIEEMDMSRQKRKNVLDQLAAVKILEGFIFFANHPSAK